MIAPFWGAIDMRYYYVAGGDGAFVDTSVPNYVTFRFATTPVTNNNSSIPPSVFAVRLGADGSIRFDYGANLNGITPVIGVSAGTGRDYSVASISGLSTLSNHGSVVFTPNVAEGRTYYDIGALEFEGSSADTLPPTIVSGINLPANGASTDAAFGSITLNVSETLDQISANSAANYQLVEAGADHVFDTPDDTVISLTPILRFGIEVHPFGAQQRLACRRFISPLRQQDQRPARHRGQRARWRWRRFRRGRLHALLHDRPQRQPCPGGLRRDREYRVRPDLAGDLARHGRRQ